MKEYCCICGNAVGDLPDGLLIKGKNYPICEDCGSLLDALDNDEKGDSQREDAYTALQKKMRDNRSSSYVIETVESIYNQEEEPADPYETDDRDEQEEDGKESELDLEEQYDELSSRLLLTTANNLEGYHVTKHLGIVFGETVYKPSAGQQFVSSIGDTFRGFSFSAKEMTGQLTMIEEARMFAYIKMMKAAFKRGANAIIAIESDNTIGNNIFYTSLYGTAVYVEKDEGIKR